jgi:hypothetical protein
MQIQQATVRVYHDRLAPFAKLAAIGILAGRLHGNARKYARTAPLVVFCRFCQFRHDLIIVQRPRAGVNRADLRGVQKHSHALVAKRLLKSGKVP